tara:strand:- start:271700 stop:274018 length:2319 start_codon:yes stop_codon:yes gene_type:complete
MLLITVGMTFVTLLVALLITIAGNYLFNVNETKQRVGVIASFTAQGIISSLDFIDPISAKEKLKSLNLETSVRYACAYDLTDTLFAQYQNKELLTGGRENCPLQLSRADVQSNYQVINLIRPIGLSEEERLGYLLLSYDMGSFNKNLLVELLFDVIVFAVVMLLVYFIANKLQFIISRPVSNLEAAARQFVDREDFSIQVEKTSDDELGSMVDAFNLMVKKMEEREHFIMQAREEAESANRMKSKFLANMSHELRTPLNSIMGMTELIIDTENMDQDTLDMSKVIYKSSQNLLDIVNDILDISKIESGMFTLEHNDVNINDLINNLVDSMRPVASQKGVSLTCHYTHKDVPVIMGDCLRLNQILTNLIGNAIKYIKDPYEAEGDVDARGVNEAISGLVQLEIGYTVIGDDNIELSVEVKDNGIGISEDKVGAIFEKFRQADDTITRRFGGTGLGLTITKDLVQMMGGEIGVRSTFGLGSLFWFKIPFRLSTCKDAVTPVINNVFSLSLPQSGVGTRFKAQDVRLLVAEDVVLNQHYIMRLLKHIGINNFKLAENGEVVLSDFNTGEYDLILMDCHMPLKNGYETTHEIRSVEKNTKKRIPIIAMTADAMKGAEEKCFEAGMDAYVAKPVEIQHLKEVLATWIDFSTTALSLRHQEEVLTKHEAKPPVDLKIIKGFIGSQVEVGNFVKMFKMQGDDFLRKLNGTCRGGESKEWVEISHGFKGCCMMIGAQELVEHLQDAEELLVANKSDRVQSLDLITKEYRNVVSFLENLEY